MWSLWPEQITAAGSIRQFDHFGWICVYKFVWAVTLEHAALNHVVNDKKYILGTPINVGHLTQYRI